MQVISVRVLDDIDVVLIIAVPMHEKGDELFSYLSPFLRRDVSV